MLKLHISVPAPPKSVKSGAEVSIEIRYCQLDSCGRAFVPIRLDHRFCCHDCKDQHHNFAKKLRGD